MELKAAPKKKQGRPAKYLNPEKAFEWFDEDAWNEAKRKYSQWEEQYKQTKIITGSNAKTLDEFDKELRAEKPDLSKLDIHQLYILKGLDRIDIKKAFSELTAISCPATDKETYTVKIPAEKANEYSWYLSICEAFNNIRQAGNTNINSSMLPGITANRIVLDHRSMKLIPNPYLFTKDAL